MASSRKREKLKELKMEKFYGKIYSLFLILMIMYFSNEFFHSKFDIRTHRRFNGYFPKSLKLLPRKPFNIIRNDFSLEIEIEK
jgi:hypothetical protein